MSKSEKKRLLKFVQDNKLSMMKNIPGFISAELNEESDGLILTVAQPLLESPQLSDAEGDIAFKVEIKFPEAAPKSSKAVVSLGDNRAASTTAQNDKTEDEGVVGVVVMPFKQAINPQETGGRKKEAFEAWQKRYKK